MSNSITYSPEVKVFYGHIANPMSPSASGSPDQRLIPAPFISVSTEFNYANDTIIGYKYNVEFTGTVTALDLRELENNQTYNDSNYNSIGKLVDHIRKLRKILSTNGGILLVKDKDNTTILRASGGILKSFNIDQSKWTDTAPYSATIEFNNVEFIGNNVGFSPENCSNIFLEDNQYTTNTNGGILDLTKYKIKSFEDNWNIEFNHDEMTNLFYVDNPKRDNSTIQLKPGNAATNDGIIDLGFYNMSFNISYSINVTGQDFYLYDSESEPKLIPAWQQAKNFAQHRLQSHVSGLINNILMGNNAGIDTCTPLNRPLEDIHGVGPVIGNSGLLSSINVNNAVYGVFNEVIECQSSESQGTFSLNYSAVIKNNQSSKFRTPNCKHTFTKNISTDKSNGIPIKNISIQGTIEGLISGGLVQLTGQQLALPASGSLFIYNNSNASKYNNALACLNTIYSNSDNNAGLGVLGKRDFKKEFKELLGLYNYNDGKDYIGSQINNLPDFSAPITNGNIDENWYITPTNFSITHDYHNGVINYNATYSNNNCYRKYREVSIQVVEPEQILATFTIPNSNSCPVIQRIGTKNAKTIDITVNGVDLSTNGVYNIGTGFTYSDWSNLPVFDCGCGDQYLPIELPIISSSYILTQKRYSHNPMNGSFTVNLTYIAADGCLGTICSS
jgi:hypothetical protein